MESGKSVEDAAERHGGIDESENRGKSELFSVSLTYVRKV